MLKKLVGTKEFYKSVLAICLPIMLQNGITNFVNMLDNLMVGRLGNAEMTGVSIANQLIFVFSLCVFGAVSGAGIFGAQFYGKKDMEGLRYTFRFKFISCVLLAAVAILIFIFGGSFLINQFLAGEGDPNEAAAAFVAAKKYLSVMLIGLVPFAIVQCYSGTLRETGEAVLPMKAGIIAVGVNLLFNYLLIYGKFGFPHLEVEGAAIATVLSRFVELIIVVFWTHKNKQKNPYTVGAYRSFRIPLKLAWAILISGMPLMINEALWASGTTTINQCYSLKGLNVVSATNISQTFWNLFAVVFMAVGISIGIKVGQLLGASEFDKAKDTAYKMMAFSVSLGILVGALYFAFSGVIPQFYKTNDDVKHIATNLIMVSAVFMPISAFVHASYFTLRSGGKVILTFLFDSLFVWCITVPVAFVLSRYSDISIIPMFAVCQAVDLIKVVAGFILIKKGVWINNLVDNPAVKELNEG